MSTEILQIKLSSEQQIYTRIVRDIFKETINSYTKIGIQRQIKGNIKYGELEGNLLIVRLGIYRQQDVILYNFTLSKQCLPCQLVHHKSI